MNDVTLSDRMGLGGPLFRVDPAIMHMFRAWTPLLTCVVVEKSEDPFLLHW